MKNMKYNFSCFKQMEKYMPNLTKKNFVSTVRGFIEEAATECGFDTSIVWVGGSGLNDQYFEREPYYIHYVITDDFTVSVGSKKQEYDLQLVQLDNGISIETFFEDKQKDISVSTYDPEVDSNEKVYQRSDLEGIKREISSFFRVAAQKFDVKPGQSVLAAPSAPSP